MGACGRLLAHLLLCPAHHVLAPRTPGGRVRRGADVAEQCRGQRRAGRLEAPLARPHCGTANLRLCCQITAPAMPGGYPVARWCDRAQVASWARHLFFHRRREEHSHIERTSAIEVWGSTGGS